MIPVAPGPNKTFEAFGAEQSYCQQYATAQTAPQAYAATNQAVGMTILTTALGAALGGAVGGMTHAPTQASTPKAPAIRGSICLMLPSLRERAR